MCAGDVAAVARIEEGALSPWSFEQVLAELKRATGVSLVAATTGGRILAWCCGIQLGHEAEILKIAVGEEWKRMGLAMALLNELCRLFEKWKADKVFLEVRSQNYPALHLYTALDFREVGRRKRYYKEPVDDAVVFVRRLKKTHNG